MLLFVDLDNNKKLTKDEVHFAFYSYVKHLLNNYWDYKIKVSVTFGDEYKVPRISGYVMESDDPDEDYYIWIRKSCSKHNQLITLAHECVHLKQILKDELSIDEMKRAEPNDDSAYWDDPREIEAFGRELGLYFRYIKSFGIEI